MNKINCNKFENICNLIVAYFVPIYKYNKYRDYFGGAVMKKKIFALALSVCVLAVVAFLAIPTTKAYDKQGAENTAVNKALQTRFLNMLNRNFVYNSDFESADVVTENSVLALLDRRDSENPDYISEETVKGFVYDMYGIKIVEITEDEDVHKDGFVFIVPCGFTRFNHKITSIIENEDGSFTVTSDVNVNAHDDEPFVTTAETLFVPNVNSAFGYNIVYSNLKGVESEI